MQTRAGCHAEGRGFESHHPLSRKPWKQGLRVLRAANTRPGLATEWRHSSRAGLLLGWIAAEEAAGLGLGDLFVALPSAEELLLACLPARSSPSCNGRHARVRRPRWQPTPTQGGRAGALIRTIGAVTS